MNDKHLVSFITVADKGSFYRAAQALYLTPQTLIQQMNQLEAEVGAKLFDRSNKGALLTAAGQEFYQGAHRLIEVTNETLERTRSMDNAQRESIRVGMTQMKSMLLPDICLAFSIKYPEIYIKTVPIEMSDWVSLLGEEKVDVIEGDVTGDYASLQVEMTKLVRDRRACIMSPAHPLTAREVIRLSDLAAYRVCVNNLSWLQSLRSQIRVEAPSVKLIERPTAIPAVFEICLDGGIFIAPEKITSRFAPLVWRPLDIDLQWDFGIAYLKHHNTTVDKFIEVAKDVFAPKA